jgi:hypothetical protein
VSRPAAAVASGDFVNFAIRGGGIISSSPYGILLLEFGSVLNLRGRMHSEQRYRELQLLGEEPDMLVMRSFAQASLFTLDDEEEGQAEDIYEYAA